MNAGGQHPGSRRNGHTHKILAPRPPGILRLGIMADVEARQPRNPANEKEKTDKSPGVKEILAQLRVDGGGQKVKAPDESQQAGRHPEGDRVGQRIQFLAEIAACVGHAGDAAVERIEGNRKNNGDGRPIQMLSLIHI